MLGLLHGAAPASLTLVVVTAEGPEVANLASEAAPSSVSTCQNNDLNCREVTPDLSLKGHFVLPRGGLSI